MLAILFGSLLIASAAVWPVMACTALASGRRFGLGVLVAAVALGVGLTPIGIAMGGWPETVAKLMWLASGTMAWPAVVWATRRVEGAAAASAPEDPPERRCPKMESLDEARLNVMRNMNRPRIEAGGGVPVG
jgi:hypothetical protein